MKRAAAGPALPERIGEYRLVRPLGRGAMGQVYLAEDTLLDRPVAVKLIAARRPGEAARRRFFIEARAVARLSHPNVVAVHRVGEHEGLPYLVTELVRGRSLAEVPKPLPPDRAQAIAVGLARGLAAAHRSGVLHRDIKPANVMLTDEGEVKILDFGLAKIAEAPPADPREDAGEASVAESGERGRAGEIAGTPLYLAPEVLGGAPASRQSDVYAAGALLFELCVGRAPRETMPEGTPLPAWIAAEVGPLLARAPALDPRFAAAVDRCLAPDPAARFPTADALGDALAAMAPEAALAAVPEGNPYRGLTAFEAQHRALFFGRDAETAAVVDRLRADGLVTVTGDSGVGKSSLCRAGALPVAEGGALGDGRRTRAALLVPGRHPLSALVTAVAAALSLPEAPLRAELAEDPEALARAVRAALGADRGLVVFVDQLEEVCTLAAPEEAALFAAALSHLPAPAAGVRLLLAVRGDFFTRVAALPALGDALSRSLYLLRPLSPEGVRAAVTGPAARKGVTFSPPALVDTLAAAAAGGLPVLQFALAELWEARRGEGPLTAAALEAMGGVEGALARHADEVLLRLDPEARAAARRILLALVTAERTRARRTEAELSALAGPARAALEALVRGRLIVAGSESSHELAHEALIRGWQTLSRWLDETHDQKLALQEIEQASDLWSRRGRAPEETWTGEALTRAAHRVARGDLDLPAAARAFLDAGLARRDAEQRRRRWLLGSAGAALLTVAVASTTAAVAFREKQREAVRQQAQIRLAAADLGELRLVLAPYDWDAATQKATPAAVPAGLDYRLHAVSADDAQKPGRRYGAEDLRRSERRVEGAELHERVEARSGPAYLEVVGRGEGCGSSWLYLRRLPGYTDRAAGNIPEWRIPVPTCQASRADMVEIPGGEFYRNVDPGPVDELATLPAFWLDRTEVTRGAFAVYGGLEGLTGDGAARTSYLNLDRAGGEKLPVVGVNSFTAAAYCRFMGKELPTVEQWQKALRGGLTVRGVANPDPKRVTPWGEAGEGQGAGKGAGKSAGQGRHPSNIDDDGDGAEDLAAVGSFPEDVSPYGVMDMGGNVSEWSRVAVDSPDMRGLRYTNGTSWVTPPGRLRIDWRNVKPEKYLDFTIGIRCSREGGE